MASLGDQPQQLPPPRPTEVGHHQLMPAAWQTQPWGCPERGPEGPGRPWEGRAATAGGTASAEARVSGTELPGPHRPTQLRDGALRPSPQQGGLHSWTLASSLPSCPSSVVFFLFSNLCSSQSSGIFIYHPGKVIFGRSPRDSHLAVPPGLEGGSSLPSGPTHTTNTSAHTGLRQPKAQGF